MQRLSVFLLITVASCLASLGSHAQAPEAIARVKPSVVAVGTYEKTRNPQFSFRGTGFAIGDGSLVATNAHVLPAVLDPVRGELLVVAIPGQNAGAGEVRTAKQVAFDRDYDLAILRIDGNKLPPVPLGDSSKVREGQTVLFTGFPIGSILGLVPATHRAMVAAMTPIAVPSATAGELDARAIRRLSNPAYYVMQLDSIAYPGNSGSPLYDPENGQVIGIINMVFVKGSRENVLSQPSGISYAIPSLPLANLLKNVK